MTRRKGAQQRPECWWCTRPEASNEDVVPLWVGRKYPQPSKWIHVNAHPELGDYRTKEARRPSVKTRKFCRQCNNGWMSALEEAVIPALEPMMRGIPTRLSEKDQDLLALWVFKTVFAFQTLQTEEHRFIDRGLYRDLFRDRRPPIGAQVWLGSRKIGESVAWHRAHSLGRDGGSGFGATLALGAMVAHLIWQDDAASRLQLDPKLRGALIQIWPIKRPNRYWPPPQQIGDGDLSWFAKEVASAAELIQAEEP